MRKKEKNLNPQTTVNPLLSIQSVSRNSQQFRESSRLAQMRQGYKTTVQSGASGVKHFPQAPVCRSLLVITTWFSGRMDQTGRISSRLRWKERNNGTAIATAPTRYKTKFTNRDDKVVLSIYLAHACVSVCFLFRGKLSRGLPLL